MIKQAAPVANYALQQYKMPEIYKEQDLFRLKKTPHTSDIFEKAKLICEKYAEKVIIR